MQPQFASTGLVLGNLIIDAAGAGVVVDGRPAGLAACELALLQRLCAEPDRIIDYDNLCEAVWSSRGPRERRRLSVVVCRLRAKLSGAWPIAWKRSAAAATASSPPAHCAPNLRAPSGAP